MNSRDLLRIENLSVIRRLPDGREKPLLRNVNLCVKEGRCTALIGRSGVGKSLTFRAILGLLRPPQWRLEGNIIFCDAKAEEQNKSDSEVGKPDSCHNQPAKHKKMIYLDKRTMKPIETVLPVEERPILENGEYQDDVIKDLMGHRITAVFQGPDSHLHPSLSIWWQLGETINPRRPWSGTLKQSEDRLKDFHIPDKLRNYPHQLSQGQRQRVLTAMALSDSELIVADEPTSALDDGSKAMIITLLKELRSKNKLRAVLLISHDLKLVRELLASNEQVILMEGDGHGGPSCTRSPLTVRETQMRSAGGGDLISLLGRSEGEEAGIQRVGLYSVDPLKPILTVSGLGQKYRSGLLGTTKTILEDVNFTVNRGDFFGIVGESGCGKTTLIKAIARLLPNTSGTIVYHRGLGGEGVDLNEIQPDGAKTDSDEMRQIRREIQVIFQNTSSILNPRMTIGSLLSESLLHVLGTESSEERFRRIGETLVDLGVCTTEEKSSEVFPERPYTLVPQLSKAAKTSAIDEILTKRDYAELRSSRNGPPRPSVEELLAKYPHELSGGQRQRIVIARVFLVRPKIVIADEPFADQDILTQIELLRIMRKMRAQFATTFIIVSHAISMINRICDRVIRIDRGTVAIDYDPRDRSRADGITVNRDGVDSDAP